MENIGLNSEVFAGGKKFHIQTQYLEPNEKVVSTIFDDGKVTLTKSVELALNAGIADIKLQVNKLHQDMISDIELLFYISDKVKMIEHAISNNKLGLVFLSKNLIDEAMGEFKRAIEIDPELVEAYNNLGRAYLKQKHYQEAIDILNAGIKTNPDYADVHNNLGYVYFKLNYYSEAIAELQRAIELNSDYVVAMFNLCLVYLKTIVDEIGEDENLPSMAKRMEKIKSLLVEIKDKRHFFKPENIETVLTYLEKENIEEAVNALELAESERAEIVDYDFENEFYLKFMFGGKGKDDDFILDYTNQLKEIVRKYPHFADLRNSLGVVYLIQCRNLFLNALEEFRQALKINPTFKKAEKNLKLAENDGKGFLILLRAILK